MTVGSLSEVAETAALNGTVKERKRMQPRARLLSRSVTPLAVCRCKPGPGASGRCQLFDADSRELRKQRGCSDAAAAGARMVVRLGGGRLPFRRDPRTWGIQFCNALRVRRKVGEGMYGQTGEGGAGADSEPQLRLPEPPLGASGTAPKSGSGSVDWAASRVPQSRQIRSRHFNKIFLRQPRQRCISGVKCNSSASGRPRLSAAYAGLVTGDVAVFDLRAYAQPLALLAAPRRQPCHTILPVPASLGGGILAAAMNVVTDWQGADPASMRAVPLPAVGLTGACCSLDWEPSTGSLLCALRPPGDGSAAARLQLLSPVQTAAGREWVPEQTFTGHTSRTVLARAAAVPGGKHPGDGFVAAADEGSGCVALWSLKGGDPLAAQQPFRLPPHESAVLDIRVDAESQRRCVEIFPAYLFPLPTLK